MNKKIFLKLIFFFLIAMGVNSSVYSQHILKASVFGNGGGTLTGTSNIVHSTLGQNYIGISSNSMYTAYSGFWNTKNILTNVNEHELGLPTEFNLNQNYPNPFNPSTTIKYSLPAEANIRIEVFNMLGELVEVLVDEIKSAGYYQITFNASYLSSGMYIYRMTSNDFIETKKLMLIK